MRHSYDLPDLVIPSGETESNAIDAHGFYKYSEEFVVSSPATLPETVTLHVSVDGGTTYQAFQEGGSDLTFTADKVRRVPYDGWDSMKLVAGAGVGADRTFGIRSIEDI